MLRPTLLLIGLALATPTIAASPASRQDQLQQVVRLCARSCDSAEFTQAWSEFVRARHEAGLDLDRTIEQVLARASARRQSGHATTGELSWSAADRKAARLHMQATALATLRELAG